METLGNSFRKKEESFGSGKNIWHEIKGAYPCGGKITNISDFVSQGVIPSGSMCQFDQVKNEIKIIKSAEIKLTDGGGEVEPNTIKGLLQNDVYVKSDTTFATGSVVFAGEIYSDRCAEKIPAEVFAALPMIVPIREKADDGVLSQRKR